MTTIILMLSLWTSSYSEDTVDISVLSLLKPRELIVNCTSPGELKISTNDSKTDQSIQLNPGEAARIAFNDNLLHLEINSEAGSFVAKNIVVIEVKGEESQIELIAPNPFTRSFRGSLAFRPKSKGISIILTAPLEQIVGEVTAAEMGTSGVNKQALMAQSVCVRSYLVSMRNRKPGFVFEDTTQSLLYRGRDGAFGTGGQAHLRKGEEAAQATKGVVISYASLVVPGYFHACCGGNTATPKMAWKETYGEGAFATVKCGLCKSSPHYRWQKRIAASELRKVFPVMSGQLTFSTKNHPGSGYIAQVEITSGERKQIYEGDQFRIRIGRALGWSTVRSNVFTVKRENGFISFDGYGFGHGVGFCQEGAIEADRRGWGWRQILRFYFPRCTLVYRESLSLR